MAQRPTVGGDDDDDDARRYAIGKQSVRCLRARRVSPPHRSPCVFTRRSLRPCRAIRPRSVQFVIVFSIFTQRNVTWYLLDRRPPLPSRSHHVYNTRRFVQVLEDRTRSVFDMDTRFLPFPNHVNALSGTTLRRPFFYCPSATITRYTWDPMAATAATATRQRGYDDDGFLKQLLFRIFFFFFTIWLLFISPAYRSQFTARPTDVRKTACSPGPVQSNTTISVTIHIHTNIYNILLCLLFAIYLFVGRVYSCRVVIMVNVEGILLLYTHKIHDIIMILHLALVSHYIVMKLDFSATIGALCGAHRPNPQRSNLTGSVYF